MNLIHQPFFSLIEWPALHIYEQAAADVGVPTLEIVRTYYDTTVMNQLRDLHWDINPGGALQRIHHPWNLDTLSEEEVANMRELINMEPVLSKEAYQYILNKSHCCYMDDVDDEIFNEPIKRVW